MSAPQFPPPHALAPPPFRFQPARDPLRVPAFSRFFRALAVLLVLACGVWMGLLWADGKLTPPGTPATVALGWPLAALAMMAWTLFHILTSTTTLTAEGLHQRWVWDKRMPLRELAYARLIRVPGLDWLVAPRLYTRTLLGKFAVFYAADAAMLAEFERLVIELRTFRGTP